MQLIPEIINNKGITSSYKLPTHYLKFPITNLVSRLSLSLY
jgi:hypothetical protein